MLRFIRQVNEEEREYTPLGYATEFSIEEILATVLMWWGR